MRVGPHWNSKRASKPEVSELQVIPLRVYEEILRF
jgi:hypothetical protein